MKTKEDILQEYMNLHERNAITVDDLIDVTAGFADKKECKYLLGLIHSGVLYISDVNMIISNLIAIEEMSTAKLVESYGE